MGVKDYVGNAVTIKQTSQFEINDLYKKFKVFFSSRGYRVFESNYTEKPASEGKQLKFFWSASRKMDNYTKIVIEMAFTSVTKDVVIEKDEKMITMQEGDVEAIVSAYINKDIEDDWAIRTKTGFQRFLREMFDRLWKKDKFDSYEAQLKKDTEAIIYDAKTYLKMHRFD